LSILAWETLDLDLSTKLPIILTQWYYKFTVRSKKQWEMPHPLEDLSHSGKKKKKLLFGKSSGCKSVAHCNETFCNNKTLGQVARLKTQEWIMLCLKANDNTWNAWKCIRTVISFILTELRKIRELGSVVYTYIPIRHRPKK
jgi:hypothetical protein